MMLKVGVTGSIGSGKSTVCKIFEGLGIEVYNSDLRAKHLLNRSQKLIVSIREEFGEEMYNAQGDLDRAQLASVVFHDKEKLERLNAIVHPAVQEDFERWVMLRNSNLPYILKEAALLVETGSYKQLDYLICVAAPLELRISRIIARDNADRESVIARIANQLPDEEKMNVADFIIRNDDDSLLIPQVLQIHEELVKRSREAARVSPE